MDKTHPSLLWRTEDLTIAEFVKAELQWMCSDTEENWKNLCHHAIYSPGSINYRLNDYGYRCDDFNIDPNSKIRFLFNGCSNTCGIGLPLQETWTYKLYQRINITYGFNAPYWNLAHGGRSFDYIVRSLYLAVPLLQPTIVFLLIPPVVRFEHPTNSGVNDIGTWSMNHDILLRTFTEEQFRYNFAKNIRFVELLAERYNFELFWSTWNTLPTTDFSNAIGSRQWKTNFIHDRKARDGIHSGAEANAKFADMLFSELEPQLTKIIQARL